MCDPVPVVEVPCSCCGGEGIVDYRDGSLIEHWRTCPACRGDGTELVEGYDVTEDERMDEE